MLIVGLDVEAEGLAGAVATPSMAPALEETDFFAALLKRFSALMTSALVTGLEPTVVHGEEGHSVDGLATSLAAFSGVPGGCSLLGALAHNALAKLFSDRARWRLDKLQIDIDKESTDSKPQTTSASPSLSI
jgi:hypothetical protein